MPTPETAPLLTAPCRWPGHAPRWAHYELHADALELRGLGWHGVVHERWPLDAVNSVAWDPAGAGSGRFSTMRIALQTGERLRLRVQRVRDCIARLRERGVRTERISLKPQYVNALPADARSNARDSVRKLMAERAHA